MKELQNSKLKKPQKKTKTKDLIVKKPFEYVLIERLGLRTTRFEIERFGIPAELKYIKSEEFKKTFSTWNQFKQKTFVIALGGVANKEITLKFLGQ